MVIDHHYGNKGQHHGNGKDNQPLDHPTVGKPALKNAKQSQQNGFDFIHFDSTEKNFEKK
jgi:hypothetical protein